MADARHSAGLQIIFAIFLGLMVTAFVGVGAYTFYPPPARFSDQIRDLNRQEQAIRNSNAPEALTPADRARLQEIRNELNTIEDAGNADRASWGRITSIVLIAFATLAMALSLVRAEQMPVISSGLLVGGVFTMMYGVGWIIATDTSVARFLVMTAALVVTLASGYVRFVRRRSALPAPDRAAAVPGLGDLEQRVRGLEQRIDDAARVLGRTE